MKEQIIEFGAKARPFKFGLSQVVEMCVSDEWGEVKARSQHADGENQYLIHYKAADGRATTNWFGESMLQATEDERYPGCPVFACMELPEGAVVEDDGEWSPHGERVLTGIVDGQPQYARIEMRDGGVRLIRE